jgi:hypothetical protein
MILAQIPFAFMRISLPRVRCPSHLDCTTFSDELPSLYRTRAARINKHDTCASHKRAVDLRHLRRIASDEYYVRAGCTHSEGKSGAVNGVARQMISALRTAASITVRSALERPSQAAAGYARDRSSRRALRRALSWQLKMVMCAMKGRSLAVGGYVR